MRGVYDTRAKRYTLPPGGMRVGRGENRFERSARDPFSKQLERFRVGGLGRGAGWASAVQS